MRPPLKEEEEEEEEPPRRRKLVEKDLKRKRRERINDLVSSKRKLKTGGSRGGGIAIKFPLDGKEWEMERRMGREKDFEVEMELTFRRLLREPLPPVLAGGFRRDQNGLRPNPSRTKREKQWRRRP